MNMLFYFPIIVCGLVAMYLDMGLHYNNAMVYFGLGAIGSIISMGIGIWLYYKETK